MTDCIDNEADKDNPDAFYVSMEKYHAYVEAGRRLRKLHLMQEKTPAELTIEPNDSDNMTIESIKYTDGILHINKHKRILGIPQEVWQYRISGYQVIDKWLKSHKGETLTIEHFDHISSITGILQETIKIQQTLRELHKEPTPD